MVVIGVRPSENAAKTKNPEIIKQNQQRVTKPNQAPLNHSPPKHRLRAMRRPGESCSEVNARRVEMG
jgi:hypothetical protein